MMMMMKGLDIKPSGNKGIKAFAYAVTAELKYC